jgi:hypothetical protein
MEKLSVGRVIFAEMENLLAFGPVVCGTTTSRGVMERVKITNPTKIDVKVKFLITNAEITKSEQTSGGKKVPLNKNASKKGLSYESISFYCGPQTAAF